MRTWESGQLRKTWLLVRTNLRSIQVGPQLSSAGCGSGQLQASLKGEEPAAKFFESAGTELLFPPPCGAEAKVELVIVLGGLCTPPYWTYVSRRLKLPVKAVSHLS